jgi:hypothetical protein
MTWYKKAQLVMAYHGTDPSKVSEIKNSGLNPGSFFSSNEDDISQYVDGIWLRFPFPQNYKKRIGRGDYYNTIDRIPPEQIEIKTDIWDDYVPIQNFAFSSKQNKLKEKYANFDFDPQQIADQLGIKYNGPNKEGTKIIGHMFTDNITGSSFLVREGKDPQKRLQEMRQLHEDYAKKRQSLNKNVLGT